MPSIFITIRFRSLIFLFAILLCVRTDAIAKYKDDPKGNDELWKSLFLAPHDYTHDAIFDPTTRALMSKIVFEHGGKEFDDNYPDGIPTEIVITDKDGKVRLWRCR